MNLISTKSLFLEVALLISFCNGQLLEKLASSSQLIELNEYLGDNSISIGGVTLDALQTIFKALKSSSFPTAFANLTNEKCVQDSQLYVRNLYNSGVNSSWARQMYESSGDYLPLGFFGGSGSLHSDGLFDECIAIRGPEEENFRGQYCSVFISLAPVIEFEMVHSSTDGETENSKANVITIFQLINQLLGGASNGILLEPKVAQASATTSSFPSTVFCLPSSCTANDLGQAVAQLIGTNILPNNYSIVTLTDEGYCFTDNPSSPSFDGPDIAVIVTLSLIGLLVVVSTVHEVWRTFHKIPYDPKTDGIVVSYLHCFSFLNNGRKLLSMKSAPGGGNLNCIHGIRVLSTLWVVIGHTWSNGPFVAAHNVNAVMEDAKSWWFQGVHNATVSVDTFFVMSGLLVSYLLLRELDRNGGKFNVGLFYLHRYLRLTPVYAIILGFVATLMVYIGTGPNWIQVEAASISCRVSWWKNLLYIQNFMPATLDENCMGQTWYLSVDMQLFIIAPIFVYLLWRWQFRGQICLFLALFSSILANFLIFSLLDLQPAPIYTRQKELVEIASNFQYFYDVPWTRAPPYFIGIYLGWLLYKTEEDDRKHISNTVIGFIWIFTLAMFGAIIFGLIPYLDESTAPDIPKAITIIYGSLHRVTWSIGISWIIFACVRGYGGIFVNSFLSWKGFRPLGRLTYCVYLIHYDFLNIFFARNRKQLYYTFTSTLITYFGIVVTVFGLAFLVSATIEASFLNLEKLLFQKPKEATEKRTNKMSAA